MPKTELGYKHLIHFETVTPVAVGDGGTLSPLGDYTVNPSNKQQALLLNQNVFEKWLENNELVLNDYLKQVKAITTERKNQFLYQFIASHHPSVEVSSFFLGTRNIVGDFNTTDLKTCIKDCGRPYIPGSSLKGAFKSVWLYIWLAATPKKVEEIIRILKDNQKEKDARRKIEELLDESLDNNPRVTRRLEFSALQIGDGYCNGLFNWYHTNRYHILTDNNNYVPLFIEAIEPHSKGSFELFVEDTQYAQTNHPGIRTLKADTLEPFFKQINHYALAQIEHEQEMILNEELFAYKQFLHTLKSDIIHSSNHSAWLPVGFGKSNFYQSIGLHIRKCDKQIFETYIKLFKMGKNPDKRKNETDQKELPLTRNLTLNGYYPLGWIRLYDTETVNEPVAVSKFEKGMQLEATVFSISRPLSKIQIPGVDEVVNMSGTKEAQKNSRFKEQAVVVVEIDLNKEGKISQARFVRIK